MSQGSRLDSRRPRLGEMTLNLFDSSTIKWRRFQGDAAFDYPIDYEAALLSIQEDGHVDLLYRWAPHSYCHFHRHTAETRSTVLAGELHVIDVDLATGQELGSRIRHVGDFACKEPGDVHMERGGPDGALVLFNLYAPDGVLAEALARDGTVLSVSTVAQILERRKKG